MFLQMPPKRKTIRIEPMNPIPEQILANEQPLENKHDQVSEDTKQPQEPVTESLLTHKSTIK